VRATSICIRAPSRGRLASSESENEHIEGMNVELEPVSGRGEKIRRAKMKTVGLPVSAENPAQSPATKEKMWGRSAM
jgi:hypothetical protein